MKEFITRTLVAIPLIGAAFVWIKYVPENWFALILFLIISAGAHELVKLAQPGVYSLTVVFLSGLLVALAFIFNTPELPAAIMGSVILISLFFLFALRDKKKLATFTRDIGVHFLTVFYLYIPLFFLFELKRMGPNYLFFLVFVIAVGDSGAYFVGSAIGKHKIYPVASPNKSLEGLIAAVVTAGLTGWLSLLVFPVQVSVTRAIITGAVTGLLSQLSDPVESLFKRAAGKKDSSSLLPAHGGVLDRVDSYIFCAPVLYYVITYFWK